ncbi:MAG: hypothetical protein AAFV26_05705 [Pseudomonadota bacterium]
MFNPLQAQLAAGQIWWQACISSQQQMCALTLSAFDTATRGHERPEQAADRASTARDTGGSGSWYRKPVTPWSELASGLVNANPFVIAWQQMAMAPFGLAAQASMMPSPAMAGGLMPFGMSNPFAQHGLPFAAPAAAMAVQPVVMMMQSISKLAGSMGARAELASEAVTTSNGTKARDAVASITMPDQTVFKIAIPMVEPIAAWPWAGSYAGSGFAAEARIEDEKPAADEAKLIEASDDAVDVAAPEDGDDAPAKDKD